MHDYGEYAITAESWHSKTDQNWSFVFLETWSLYDVNSCEGTYDRKVSSSKPVLQTPGFINSRFNERGFINFLLITTSFIISRLVGWLVLTNLLG